MAPPSNDTRRKELTIRTLSALPAVELPAGSAELLWSLVGAPATQVSFVGTDVYAGDRAAWAPAGGDCDAPVAGTQRTLQVPDADRQARSSTMLEATWSFETAADEMTLCYSFCQGRTGAACDAVGWAHLVGYVAVAAGITSPAESFAIAGVGSTLTFEGAGIGDGDVASWVPEDAACGEAAAATAVVQDGGAEFVFNNTAAATEGALRLCWEFRSAPTAEPPPPTAQPGVALTVRALTQPALLLATQYVEVSVQLEGSGLSDADRVTWAPAGADCEEGSALEGGAAAVTNGSAVVTFVAAGTFVLCYSFGERPFVAVPALTATVAPLAALAAVEDPSLASPDLLGAVVGVNTSFLLQGSGVDLVDSYAFWVPAPLNVTGGALNVTAAAAACAVGESEALGGRQPVVNSSLTFMFAASAAAEGAPTLALCYRHAALLPCLVVTVRLRVHARSRRRARRRDRRPHVHGLLRRRRRRRRRRGGVGATRRVLQCRDAAGDRGRLGRRVGGVAGRRRVAAATVLSLRSRRRVRPIQFGRRPLPHHRHLGL